jgi:hypothetical protein
MPKKFVFDFFLFRSRIYILSIKLILFQGGKHTQSKGGILAKACEYLADLR